MPTRASIGTSALADGLVVDVPVVGAVEGHREPVGVSGLGEQLARGGGVVRERSRSFRVVPLGALGDDNPVGTAMPRITLARIASSSMAW